MVHVPAQVHVAWARCLISWPPTPDRNNDYPNRKTIMPVTKYTWSSTAPGSEPKLHLTCLSSALYTSVRWWDGQEWWDISATRGSPARPFKWPKGAAANGIKQPGWMKRYPALALRKISDQGKVRWGTPYKHFDPTEVLAWLVKQGRLPADWREAFQAEMRAGSPAQPVDSPTPSN